MPIGAGFMVAYLQKWGFSPALKFLTRAIEGVVDDSKNAALPTSYWQVGSSMLAQDSSTDASYLCALIKLLCSQLKVQFTSLSLFCHQAHSFWQCRACSPEL